VLFSPDRTTLAKRAAEWGLRLVGADGIAILDATADPGDPGRRRGRAHQLANPSRHRHPPGC